jgi:large subunit ribosomal protein L2
MKNSNFLKHLIKSKKKISGRNGHGRLTVRRRGGGHKRLYRQVNFNYTSTFYQILSNEYDPNRNTDINVVKCLKTQKLDYILASKDLTSGDIIHTTNDNKIISGGRYSLMDLPPNYIISNIELKPNCGGQIARSSGSFCKILQKDYKKKLVKIKLPSLEERFVNILCRATVGPIKNKFCHINKLNKAGNSRWLGRRPKVRGVAMNPVDHPHGGGEGKTSGGRPSVTPWGRITIGKSTRSKRKFTNSLIVKNRKQF